MTTRAKFKVQSITRTASWSGPGELHTIELNPVTSGSEENKRFFAATPGGSIKLSVVPASVGEQFAIGQEFYVDFTPASTVEERISKRIAANPMQG
jgi:hypothetical protein